MRKIRGFLIKHRVRTLFRRVLRRTLSPYKYLRLNPDEKNGSRISKLFNWGNRLKTKATRAICGKSTGQGYMPVYEDPFQENPKVVPKGKMAVYVGQKDGEFRRILVPVIYCNHPLFGELLREAEEEFGYNHPAGGLTIPCPISEFENIKTRIAATRCRRQMMTWK